MEHYEYYEEQVSVAGADKNPREREHYTVWLSSVSRI